MDFYEAIARDLCIGIMHYLLNSENEVKTTERAKELIMSIRFDTDNDHIDYECELAKYLSEYSAKHPIFDITTSMWEWLSTEKISLVKPAIPTTHILFH